MADTKISALSAVSVPAGSDEFAVNQGAVSKKETLTQIKAYTLTSPQFTGGTSTAASWPTWNSGSLLTTAEAGAIEYDGVSHYATRAAGERGIVPAEQLITLTSDYTTVSGSTSLQQMFNVPANGALTVASNVSMMFECGFHFSSLSGSSGTFSFGILGTATITRIKYLCWNRKAASVTGAAANFVQGIAASATILCAANTSGAGHGVISGKMVIGTGGTIIPAFAVSVAFAAIVAQDTYFRCWPMGSDTVTSVGNWS